MVARVTLEIALRKEFDYVIPSELAGEIEMGSRVKVPFGPRQVFGIVTALLDESETTHTNLRAITKVVGTPGLVTPKVLRLARWIGEYYCCPPEIALKSVLPEAVRHEEQGWRERLFVRLTPRTGDLPKLTKRQQEVWAIIEQQRELPMQRLLELCGCTPETVRRLEDKGLVTIAPEISERDPYANEHILPTQHLTLNAEQAKALDAIKAAMDRAAGVPPAGLTARETAPSRPLPAAPPCRQDAGSTLSPFFCKDAETEKYEGWLPHWRQANKLYFVTFRLNDSVAQVQLEAWRGEKRIWLSHHPQPWTSKVWADYHERFTEKMESLLDAGYGSCVLARPEVGAMVEKSLRFFDGARYRLADFVIMPNHVHALLQPSGEHDLASILHSWKSYTAKQANALLGLTGAFWRDEYFDHIVRSEAQYGWFCLYLRQNPVKARLAEGRFRLGCGTFSLEDATVLLAAGGPPAKPAPSQTASSCSSPAGLSGALCRQDAGSTLQPQRAAGVPPAGLTPWETAPSRPLPSAPPCRQDAGSTFLLHGVTGRGKTEVYLQALAHALENGKGGIVLVPEISLTPQTVERFKARFSSGPLQTLVAVLHSHLSAGERHDEWQKVRQGRARIVIGARSAIFAPVDPLGLIIVDEEHEHSYKQEEAPRYHARDVAVVRGQMEGAVVVLGSATPSLESFYNVQRCKYGLLELLARADDKKMPLVRVVDMRQAGKADKGTPIFSPQLKEAITQRLERKEQTILFLNRRGYSTSLQCPQCGYVAECPNCSVALTYHRQAQKLLCHICGFFSPSPKVCPNDKCRNPAIRYAGLGTQKVEDTLKRLFPQANVQRMDSDVLKRKEDYRRILGDFRAGKIDILLGTQMIAKGLHFPNVTLVGIIYADLSLHMPDFRAGERTFQLLTQVSGRAGRGDVEGEVFIQAFTPFHPAIQYARRHDFAGFYEQEIEFRDQLKYPPLARVALLTLKGRNEEKVKFSAEHLRKELEKEVSESAKGRKGEPANDAPELALSGPAPVAVSPSPRLPDSAPAPFADLIIAGPAPAPLARAETFYRYQLMLRTKQMSKLSHLLAKFTATLALPEDVTLSIDIDPVNLA